MKINKRDFGAIGFVIAIMGAISIYVGCIRNAGLLIDDLGKDAGNIFILWGIIGIVVAALLVYVSIAMFLKNNPESLSGIKKYVFGIVGIVLGVTGGILCFVGQQINDDIKRQLVSYIESGTKDATGDLLFYSGIVLVIIAVLLILINIFRFFTVHKK